MWNADQSSYANQSGDAGRLGLPPAINFADLLAFLGVVRTGRLTGRGAVRPEPPPRVKDGPLQPTFKKQRALHGGRDAPRRSSRTSSWRTRSTTVPSGMVVGSSRIRRSFSTRARRLTHGAYCTASMALSARSTRAANTCCGPRPNIPGGVRPHRGRSPAVRVSAGWRVCQPSSRPGSFSMRDRIRRLCRLVTRPPAVRKSGEVPDQWPLWC
jgi:hypothetical protein